jgi:hypothetical protein
MSALADRLRGIIASVPAARERSAPGRPTGDTTEEILGGTWHDSPAGRCLVVDRAFRPGHRHGRLTLLDHVLPAGGRWRDVLVGRAGPRGGPERQALFLDLETTGLAGGAGTYAFLVGLGWFEACTFRVRQIFLSDFTAWRLMIRKRV